MKEKIIQLLNYTQKSGLQDNYSSHGANSYQTIPLGEEIIGGRRDTTHRLNSIEFDFKDKRVLDIGCNVGGLLHFLAKDIKEGVGIDYDYTCINAANRIRAANKAFHVNFYTFNLEKDNLELIGNFLQEGNVDVCFLLSVTKWVKNWKEVIEYVYKISDQLIYEAGGAGEMGEQEIPFLRTLYQKVEPILETSEDDPNYKHRSLWVCSK